MYDFDHQVTGLDFSALRMHDRATKIKETSIYMNVLYSTLNKIDHGKKRERENERERESKNYI